jgi:hypothetical protein
VNVPQEKCRRFAEWATAPLGPPAQETRDDRIRLNPLARLGLDPVRKLQKVLVVHAEIEMKDAFVVSETLTKETHLPGEP